MKIIFGCSDMAAIKVLCRICGAETVGPELVVTGAPVLDGKLYLCRCTVCDSLTFAGDNPVIGYDFEGFSKGTGTITCKLGLASWRCLSRFCASDHKEVICSM